MGSAVLTSNRESSMALWINDSGASTEDILRGVAAAVAVFERYGVSAKDAQAAQQAIDDGEQADNVMTMRAVAWQEADAAAVKACCAGWSRIPDAAYLDLQ